MNAPPNYLFTGARVYTANPSHPWAEAVVTRANRIAHVGSEADAREQAAGAEGAAGIKGMLRPNMLADITVFRQDLFRPTHPNYSPPKSTSPSSTAASSTTHPDPPQRTSAACSPHFTVSIHNDEARLASVPDRLPTYSTAS